MRFRQRKWLLCLIGAGVMLGGFLLWYGFCVEPNLLVVRHYSIQAGEGRDSTDTPLRLVQISDLQLGENYSTGQLQKVVQRIQREQPDVLVFTGDLFEDYSQCGAELEQEVTALFSQLRAPLGKYAVWGNRDYGGGAEKAYRRILQAAGFTLLCNESVEIPLENGEELLLCGLDDSLFGKPDGQPFLQQESKAYAYRILLLHEPDVAQLWSHSAFQLILAGHSHEKNLDAYLDYSYETASEKFAEYISIHEIKRSDVDLYIRQYPMATFKYYYELRLEHVLA